MSSFVLFQTFIIFFFVYLQAPQLLQTFILMHIMMIDYFQSQSQQITTLITLMLNVQEPQIIFRPQTFTQVNIDHHFQEMIQCLVTQIMNYQLNFTNLTLVATNDDFFNRIIPLEFKKRHLQIPYSLTNYISIENIFSKHYKQRQGYKIQKIAHYFGQFRNVDHLSLLKTIILKFNQDSFLIQQKQVQIDESLSYFLIVGLPFSIRKKQLQEKLFKERNDCLQLILVEEKGRFSGKAIIKCLSKFSKMLQDKNKMTIGSRYIQVHSISQQNYKQLSDKQYIRSSPQNKDKNYQKYSSKRERRSRSRSRRRKSSSAQSIRSSNRKDYGKYKALRVRGLPFLYSSNQLEELFSRYKSIKSSAKMGHKNGRRSGQAMLLVYDDLSAERSLNLNGHYVGGRYIQIMPAKMQQYDRFT